MNENTDTLLKKVLSLPSFSSWDNASNYSIKYKTAFLQSDELGVGGFKLLDFNQSFNADDEKYAEKFYTGFRSGIKTTLMWREDSKYARIAKIRPSDNKDDNGHAIPELILFYSKTPTDDVPAALQALLLLPTLATFDEDNDFKEDLSDYDTNQDNESSISTTQNLVKKEAPSLTINNGNIIDNFSIGLEYIEKYSSRDDVSRFYSNLLNGEKVTSLFDESSSSSESSPPPEIFGVLLAFLPIKNTHSLSLTEIIPATDIDHEYFSETWNGVILKQDDNALYEEQVTDANADIESEAQKIADQLFSFRTDNYEPEPEIDDSGVSLTLWGPSSAGKTFFLAQLDFEGSNAEEDWEVIGVSKETLAFLNRLEESIREHKIFPDATELDHVEHIHLSFKNTKNNLNATLRIEDHAGAKSEQLPEQFFSMLCKSDGFILFFDPTRVPEKHYQEVRETLNRVRYETASNNDDKYSKPVAVCLSKADIYIKTPEDLYFAENKPDEFVRSLIRKGEIDSKLLDLLDNQCEKYHLFPVSALGIQETFGTLNQVVFYDNSSSPRFIPNNNNNIRTINLINPVTWLIEEINRQ